ncbi:antibiotic biosynthesis monooxygenase [Apilactobacillus sp. TMW 2.2459]|uniref:putative quinol monooxygenase n=1 Tax=Apilactobacillus xinyiensis TaxID=2841032 RepID=UPI001C7DFAA8|nr:putative quinol monooxygenase [Apilactobacillus xinyiensis]MCL0312251.1 antibiotic biosynthesis monooxygenase [Apilactobacillus xinyiensis]
MGLTVNIYYTGQDGSAKKFAKEMIDNGVVDRVRAEPGNLRYEYFIPLNDPETLLLIDQWRTEQDLDLHHKSEMMQEIAQLRSKYNLKMHVEKFENENY